MIEGLVTVALEPVIALTVRGPSGETRDIEAIVDTGFGGFLTLPPWMIRELGLPFQSTGFSMLGDGSEITFPQYRVAVLWDGQLKDGLADAAETTPLVGMQLLEWHDLLVQVRGGGRVAVEAAG